MLETFGNAKTMRNHNSSRFGKFVEVLFDDEGMIMGASIKHYLLEKSRVVTQSKEERNYHCFYQLFAGTTEDERMAKWKLSAVPEDYFYLAQSGVTFMKKIMDDAEVFQITMKHMTTLNFDAETQETIWKICAAVLHIGNVQFEGEDSVTVTTPEAIAGASHCLEIDPDDLDKALRERVLMMGGNATTSFFNYKDAINNRNALAKAVYSAMFDWIVAHINETIASDEEPAAFIGVLDIFGFEHFTNKPRPLPPKAPKVMLPNNHFEQFCINFANEMLQNFFNINIFEQEKAIYQAENIPLDDIRFQNNDLCIALVQEKDGIIDIMNDCSKPRPPTTWQQFRDRLLQAHCSGANWEPNPNKDYDFRENRSEYLDKITKQDKWKTDMTDIILHHYAGPVQYTIGSDDPDAPQDWLAKNKDKLSDDLIQLIKKSANPLIASILDYAPQSDDRNPTVARRFQSSLQELIGKLTATDALFVRTIKPNGRKKPKFFEDDMTLEQLRCAGMLETIKIRKMGYPRKNRPRDFVERYKICVPLDELAGMDFEAQAVYLCDKFIDADDEMVANNGVPYRMGTTMIFLKDYAFGQLEAAREARLKEILKMKQRAALLVQSLYRTTLMVQAIPKLEEKYENVRLWNEEKLRRMQATGKSADEIQAEMEEERRVAEEKKHLDLKAKVCGKADSIVKVAAEPVETVKARISELLDDTREPGWSADQLANMRGRIHELEQAEMEMEEATRALHAEFASLKPSLDDYDLSLADVVKDKADILAAAIAANLATLSQEKIDRAKRVTDWVKEKKRLEEEERRRVAREKAEAKRRKKEEAARARQRKLEEEEAARRLELERKMAELQAEVDAKKEARRSQIMHKRERAEERRQAARLKRVEREKVEKIEAEQREFEEQMKRKELEDLEQLEAEEKAVLEAENAAAEALAKAPTAALTGIRVKFGDIKATVKYVGPLPFYASGEWLGIEADVVVGDTPGSSGWCMGERFFECTQGHGLFVRADMVHVLSRDPAQRSDLFNDAEFDKPLGFGDMVDWEGHLGRVRYIGPTHFEAGNWIGVELDEPHGHNNGSVDDQVYFSCRRGHGIFTRAHSVDCVSLWSHTFAQRVVQDYISANDLDLYDEFDEFDDVDEIELQNLELKEAEARLRQRFGADFEMSKFIDMSKPGQVVDLDESDG
ncbi:myosin-I heavy chain class VII unconventional myosin [Thecamonas trahens ATCC 50062]|uniref:Myosin-I heavy chain class VII unconventional myosin n=1 Tax=Thecamonas trahens ATCC 50062 TaxID=461836 RepID=A0A0L0DFB6_THETB|nr:myosin-I heavy chain class VII unconventional myosin [Thecamonas trahens ATCC 50062]KNC50836.1 myosin-I heavy chain class VII unconventional myosin [Thecamonas trahens ATCC 50062]|eukprot:XP_013756791.1 myosin-I heavy chain class VII unconventional myosin [Thecamonas trahens ATCC 50062]